MDKQRTVAIYSADEQWNFSGRSNLCADLKNGKFFLKVNKIANS